ncbi:hypothetical protein ACH5RR_029922 [Cinchona calisaya]|uniref:Uncharacterized protein n=1 Tax=Cinchona calisaya TaxID=153742 RepID=A0ABD2YVD1_9GENT
MAGKAAMDAKSLPSTPVNTGLEASGDFLLLSITQPSTVATGQPVNELTLDAIVDVRVSAPISPLIAANQKYSQSKQTNMALTANNDVAYPMHDEGEAACVSLARGLTRKINVIRGYLDPINWHHS